MLHKVGLILFKIYQLYCVRTARASTPSFTRAHYLVLRLLQISDSYKTYSNSIYWDWTYWLFVCLTQCLSHKQALYDYHFFQINSFWCYFTPLLYYSDMIVPRLVRPQFFTHTVTPSTKPNTFYVTIRCGASFILYRR